MLRSIHPLIRSVRLPVLLALPPNCGNRSTIPIQEAAPDWVPPFKWQLVQDKLFPAYRRLGFSCNGPIFWEEALKSKYPFFTCSETSGLFNTKTSGSHSWMDSSAAGFQILSK